MNKKNKRKIQKEKRAIYLAAASRTFKEEGLFTLIRKTAKTIFGKKRLNWGKWMETPLYTEEELQAQREQAFPEEILFSIITPLYNTPETYLREMIASVQAQTYGRWELCLADGSGSDHSYVGRICLEYAEKDPRIKYKKLDKNLGIAGNSNACIEMAKGDFIAILDHDDVLHPAALHDVMEAICGKGADFVYTDEATFKGNDLRDITFIHFKPDYAPDTLLANNYICHFSAFRRSLIEKCGPMREGYDGAQDHELFLRLTDAAERIVHIPEVLYFWRASPQSTAEAEDNKPYVTEAGKKAVRDHLKSRGIDVTVETARDIPTIYRIKYPIRKPYPKVSIIIPNCDHIDDLRECIRSVKEKTTYPDYEILIVENNSTDPATFAYYEEIVQKYEGISVIRWSGKGFNWPAINNYAVSTIPPENYLLFLNNDIEVITPGWIEEMMMYAQRPDVGAVGAMLYYPDETVQHAGVILGVGGIAGHAFRFKDRRIKGYMGRMSYAQEMTAVTAACMLIRREIWEEAGGFDEGFAVSYNDVDFCLKVRKAGYLNVWTPFAELYHYESKSRGRNVTPEKIALVEYERGKLKERWKEEMEAGDPYYNPNFSLKDSTSLFVPRMHGEPRYPGEPGVTDPADPVIADDL